MSIKIKKGSYSTIIDSSTLSANHTITFPDTSGTVIVSSGTGGNLIDMFYPVGTIYMTADANFNPNTSWGGTWTKIENRFLYGSGTKGIGTTGGAETVTLNVNQIPSHTHDRGTYDMSGTIGYTRTFSVRGSLAENPTGVFYANSVNGSSTMGANEGTTYQYRFGMQGSRNWWGVSGANGGNGSHENMPPYLVVAIWKRTA